MIKAALTLEEVQTLFSNITITNVTKNAWFEVEESAKKIHGFKKLRDFNQAMSKEKELAETNQKNVARVKSIVASEEIESEFCNSSKKEESDELERRPLTPFEYKLHTEILPSIFDYGYYYPKTEEERFALQSYLKEFWNSEEVSDIPEEEKVPDYDMDSKEDEVASVECEVVTDQPDESLDDDDDFSDDPFFQSECFDLLCKKILPSIRKTGEYRPQTEEEHQILDDFFNQSEYSEEELEWYNRLKGTVEEELSPAQKLIQMGEALREQEKSSDKLYAEKLRATADEYEAKQLEQKPSEAEESIKYHNWGEFTVRERSDGYISLSDMFAASHVYKDYHEWFDEDETNEELLDYLSEDLSIPSVSYNRNVQAVVQFVFSDNPEANGVWGHKDLALHLSQILDPHFAVQCDEWICKLMTNGYVSLNQDSEQPLSNADKLIQYGEALRRQEKIEEQKQQFLQKNDNIFAQLFAGTH